MARFLNLSDGVSSNLKSLSYWEDESSMIVEFVSGERYEYFNISLRDFGAICGANSVGREFRKVIEGKSYVQLG